MLFSMRFIVFSLLDRDWVGWTAVM